MSGQISSAFLSSTGDDLHNHRAVVFSTINGLDGWRCVRMEDFGARPEPLWNFVEQESPNVIYL
jgi:hypothetical protein